MIREYGPDVLRYIDTVLEGYLPQKDFPENIHDAVRYSLFGDGKRVRPFLMIAVSDMLGGDPSFIEPLFSALEMIHTYSLIHDDLPCMDDDDTRRGKPTNHIVFGYPVAVLAGDALLNMAFETVLKAYGGIEPSMRERYIRAAGIISECSGILGMVGGQVADMMFDEMGDDPAALEYIYRCKTGALIRAAVLAGALSSPKADEKVLAGLDRFAYCVGMLFQLTDDILDMNGDLPEEGKMTYISVYGLDHVRKMCTDLAREAGEILSGFEDSGVLRDFTQMIYNRKK